MEGTLRSRNADLAFTNIVVSQVSKSQLLSDLEQRVKKYEKWSHVDVDKVMIELEKKEAELKQLQV